jgi:hypothetical protein
MRLMLLSAVVFGLVGCGGGETLGGHTIGGSGRSVTGAGSSGGSTRGSTSGSSGSTSGTSGSIGSTGSTGAGSTGSTGTTAAGTGTSTGGTCPTNMPNILNGQTQSSGPCTGELGSCPTGFTCVNHLCQLNGVQGGVQVTLSFDDAEDLDLHVVEPSGCEIFYANRGPGPTGNGGGCSVGWLDRDSNAGCQAGAMDGINVENVIYPTSLPAPSGTYRVLLDYWAACDAKPSSNYGIQVRANGQLFTYCGTVPATAADRGGSNSGRLITTFTLP